MRMYRLALVLWLCAEPEPITPTPADSAPQLATSGALYRGIRRPSERPMYAVYARAAPIVNRAASLDWTP